MHSVGRYLQSPLLFQNLYRYFSTNLASDSILKIDPPSSIPSKSHTTDILIFGKHAAALWTIGSLPFALARHRTDVLRVDVFYSSQGLSVTGSAPQAKALLSVLLTFAHRWSIFCWGVSKQSADFHQNHQPNTTVHQCGKQA